MLIPVKSLQKYWNVNPAYVLHVGAHEAEEYEQYISHGWGPISWVEAQPDKAKLLKTRFSNSDNVVIEAAVWDKNNVELTLKIASFTQSTSLLNFGIHREKYPSINTIREIPVTTKTLDVLFSEQKFDLIALDIQGTELRALKGFSRGLKHVKWIYTEVNKEALYKGCCLVGDLDDYLDKHGFTRKMTRWTKDSWGDALYIRNDSEIYQSLQQKLFWFFHEKIFKARINLIGKLVKIKRQFNST
jgi:FkbM family methyltransferase